jgi:RNA polymerase sigma-70 factor, ECF subfamily
LAGHSAKWLYDRSDLLIEYPAEREHHMAVPGPAGRETEQRSRWGGADRNAKASDDVLVTELYQRYRAPLLAFVLRLTAGDRQHAEDIVQETMLRAWRQAAQFDQTDTSRPSLMPWLATVARRIVIDEQRKRNARPMETDDAMLTKASVPDWTDALLRSVIVADAMLELSPAHREILNETILRDRTVNEAAEVLGIPVGTVKSRVYYALRALRVVLAEREVSL